MRCFFGAHDWQAKFVADLMVYSVMTRQALPSALHLFQCAECKRCKKRDVRVIFHATPHIMLEKAALWKEHKLEKSDTLPLDTQIFIYSEAKFESLEEYTRKLDNKPTLTLVK